MTTVYTYVVADMLHYGHVWYLERARGLGDCLIVGVLTDKACMEKKPMPIMDTMERVRVVRALGCVDSTVTQFEYSPLANIKWLKPDILVESTLHKVQPANKFVESYGGRVVVLPHTNEISSTEIKRRVIDAQQKAKRK